MTNRSKYTLFTVFDDGEIEASIDRKENVLIFACGKFFLINKRVTSIGTVFGFEDFPTEKKYSNKEIYSAFVNKDAPTLEIILNNFRNYILHKR